MYVLPTYYFKNKNEIGIDKVPLGAKVVILDYNGYGDIIEIIKIKQGTLNRLVTIEDFLSRSDYFKRIMIDVNEFDGGSY